MRAALAFALALAFLPSAAADVAFLVPAAGPVQETHVATTHAVYPGGGPPCASEYRADAVDASAGVANERVAAHADQSRSSFDCFGSVGTSETTTVSATRTTDGASASGASLTVWDHDANTGNYCGSYASALGANAQPGCTPGSQRLPYVLHVVP